MDKAIARQHIEALWAPTQEKVYEACSFLYDNGYGTADDVRMLLSFAAFHDVQGLVETLQEHIED